MTTDVLEELQAQPGVEPTRMFGASGLRVHGKTFAMLVKGRLVVKLPGARVDELVAAGAGDRFDPGHGRLMREWVSLAEATDARTCRMLMAEALRFVGAAAA
jgi:TfoX/Sxy family transcriptional regulator of competence genes